MNYICNLHKVIAITNVCMQCILNFKEKTIDIAHTYIYIYIYIYIYMYVCMYVYINSAYVATTVI